MRESQARAGIQFPILHRRRWAEEENILFFPRPEKNIPGSVLGGGVTSNDRAAVEKRNQVRRRGKGAYMKRTVGNLQIPNNQIH